MYITFLCVCVHIHTHEEENNIFKIRSLKNVVNIIKVWLGEWMSICFSLITKRRCLLWRWTIHQIHSSPQNQIRSSIKFYYLKGKMQLKRKQKGKKWKMKCGTKTLKVNSLLAFFMLQNSNMGSLFNLNFFLYVFKSIC